MSTTSAPSPHHRQPSARAPPVLPPGMPVRADHAKQTINNHNHHNHNHNNKNIGNGSGSMGPPSIITHQQSHPLPQTQTQSYTQSQLPNQHAYRHAPLPPQSSTSQQQQHQHGVPVPAARNQRPSPNPSNGSDHSHESLKESTRVNIRQSPRLPSSTLAWNGIKPTNFNASTNSPKEPWLLTPKDQSEHHNPLVRVRDEVDVQFDQLLDNLQVADSVRQKFNTVSLDVKSSILHSSTTSNPTILSSLGLPPSNGSTSGNAKTTRDKPKMKKRLSTPQLRKAKSSSSLGSPSPNPEVGQTYQVDGDQFVIVASPLAASASSGMPPPTTVPSSPSPMSPNSSHRGQSFDLSRPSPRSSTASRHSTGPRPISAIFGTSLSSGSGKGLNINMGEQPEAFIKWLNTYKGTDLKMEVERAKKLRMLLRHESTEWVRGFLEMGGYKLVLAKLQDLLDIEWREEQHDDQMLYELLRCMKALSTSEIGKSALRAHFPDPFPALSALLFSEKKPGDLASRQIIVELWLFLFDLFPSSSAPLALGPSTSSSSSSSSSTTNSRPNSVRFDSTPLLAGMGSNRRPVDITLEIRQLLVPEKPDPRAEQHDFITQVHRPKVFQDWVTELSDICRDYFWIMCHAGNTLWILDQVDESMVEKPVAPGGATGGVEFEAMNYVTMHFKLLNALCRHQAAESRDKALQLHHDLLSSGMDRILVTMRKASTTYYPSVHLELARYVSLLRAVSPNGRLPHLIEKMMGSPPEHLRKFGSEVGWGTSYASPSPQRQGRGVAR